MSAERHRRAADLFVAAARLPAGERAAFLDRECGADAALRADVDSLLAHDPGEESERFGDAPLPSIGALVTLAADAQPRQIGRYRIDGVLGRGGMGIVYRARQDNPARDVAVKVLVAGAGSEAALRRFEREAAALGRLQHPGIAQIHEAGTADAGAGPQPFFAMELVDGVPITAFAQREDLDVRARLELLIQVCRAVDHAHQRGVVHRDLKPANILVDTAGHAKVLDFGIARLVEDDVARTAERTAAGDVLGTIAYMSPEQAAGDAARVDARTDVHALGVLGYELVCGELPRDLAGRSIASMLAAVGTAPPIPLARRQPRLRGDLDTILGKALATDPRRRYPSAAELAADLRRYLDHEPIAARPPSAVYRARMLVRRHRGLAAGLLVAGLVLVAGTATSVVWALRAQDHARRADEERRSADRLSGFLEELLVAAAPAVARGQTITARDLVVRGHAVALSESGEASPARGRIMALLGRVERDMGDGARAAQMLPRAVEELRRARGGRGPDPVLADAILYLGQLRYDEGKHDEARALIEEALDLHTRLNGRDAARAAECVYALGVLAGAKGRHDEAMRLEEEAAATFEKRLGQDSARLAMALDGIGAQLNTLRRHDEAAERFERAVAILEDHGEDSLHQLARSLANLAIVRMSQDRAREAGPLFRRALEIGERIYPPDHPGLIVRLTNLATFFASQGRPAQAEPLLRRALAIQEKSAIGDQRATAHTHLSLGQIQEQQGHLEDAHASYRQALAMFEQLGGPEALDASDVLESLGRLAQRQDQAEAALAAYERALRIREKVHGAVHASLVVLLEGMRSAYAGLGREEDEERIARRIEEIERGQ